MIIALGIGIFVGVWYMIIMDYLGKRLALTDTGATIASVVSIPILLAIIYTIGSVLPH